MIRFIILMLFCITNVANANGNAVPDTMAERVKACTICHNAEGKAGRDAYYPRIAGKPQGYIFNQLRNFRDGRRYYHAMAILLENMSDEYLREMAQYFSSLQLPYPHPEQIQMLPEEIELARHLVYSGYPERNIPACSACHGDILMGVEPAIPGLVGLSRAYITAQLGGWRNGGIMRIQTSDCMSEIANQLTENEVNAVAKWLANQSVSGKPGSFNELSPELVDRCSQTILEHGGAE
ncbi:c-type cytochrome [Nitrosomonas ureae]|uniref:Cytochrome c553 n=1 Tax=Nitrosomonas ureae TaxID=44577 RepID=A0A1H5XL60_9PROT|nr:cytochrome C [Nitrosomonas ureae]SEG12087.1 Cytochrome c553 [Nitrosomonas ureae]